MVSAVSGSDSIGEGSTTSVSGFTSTSASAAGGSELSTDVWGLVFDFFFLDFLFGVGLASESSINASSIDNWGVIACNWTISELSAGEDSFAASASTVANSATSMEVCGVVLDFFFFDFFFGLGEASAEPAVSGSGFPIESTDTSRDSLISADGSVWGSVSASGFTTTSTTDVTSSELSIEICGEDFFFLDFFLDFGLVSGANGSDSVISEVSSDGWGSTASSFSTEVCIVVMDFFFLDFLFGLGEAVSASSATPSEGSAASVAAAGSS